MKNWKGYEQLVNEAEYFIDKDCIPKVIMQHLEKKYNIEISAYVGLQEEIETMYSGELQ